MATSRAAMQTNARYRQLDRERSVGVWADPEIIRARVRSELGNCSGCGEELHPDNWHKHVDTFHTGEAVSLIPQNRLTADEQTALERCESVIKAELDAFVRVGLALAEINTSRLYRATHDTFADYVSDRWNLKRSAAYDLMQTAQTAAALSEHLDTPLEYASHARALNGLEPEDAALVVELVKQTAPGGNVTTAHLKSVACVVKEVIQTGAIDDGNGYSIPYKHATLDHFKAAITEETAERMSRQAAHITAKGTPRHYVRKAVQVITSSKGVVMLTDLDPNTTYYLSMWVEGESS